MRAHNMTCFMAAEVGIRTQEYSHENHDRFLCDRPTTNEYIYIYIYIYICIYTNIYIYIYIYMSDADMESDSHGFLMCLLKCL